MSDAAYAAVVRRLRDGQTDDERAEMLEAMEKLEAQIDAQAKVITIQRQSLDQLQAAIDAARRAIASQADTIAMLKATKGLR